MADAGVQVELAGFLFGQAAVSLSGPTFCAPWLAVFLPACLPICLVYLPVCLPVCLSVCLSVYVYTSYLFVFAKQPTNAYRPAPPARFARKTVARCRVRVAERAGVFAGLLQAVPGRLLAGRPGVVRVRRRRGRRLDQPPLVSRWAAPERRERATRLNMNTADPPSTRLDISNRQRRAGQGRALPVFFLSLSLLRCPRVKKAPRVDRPAAMVCTYTNTNPILPPTPRVFVIAGMS